MQNMKAVQAINSGLNHLHEEVNELKKNITTKNSEKSRLLARIEQLQQQKSALDEQLSGQTHADAQLSTKINHIEAKKKMYITIIKEDEEQTENVHENMRSARNASVEMKRTFVKDIRKICADTRNNADEMNKENIISSIQQLTLRLEKVRSNKSADSPIDKAEEAKLEASLAELQKQEAKLAAEVSKLSVPRAAALEIVEPGELHSGGTGVNWESWHAAMQQVKRHVDNARSKEAECAARGDPATGKQLREVAETEAARAVDSYLREASAVSMSGDEAVARMGGVLLEVVEAMQQLSEENAMPDNEFSVRARDELMKQGGDLEMFMPLQCAALATLVIPDCMDTASTILKHYYDLSENIFDPVSNKPAFSRKRPRQEDDEAEEEELEEEKPSYSCCEVVDRDGVRGMCGANVRESVRVEVNEMIGLVADVNQEVENILHDLSQMGNDAAQE